MKHNSHIKAFRQLDVSCFCDVYPKVRVLDPAIHSQVPGTKLIGRARTVSCNGDLLTVIAALKDAVPGEVLVVSAGGSQDAFAGELFTLEARRKKLGGILIDGFIRDLSELRKFRFPVFARGAFPRAGKKNREYEKQVPVKVAGITIQPGELIFGDDDGVIVLSDDEFRSHLEAALALKSKETKILAKIRTGKSLFDFFS